MDIVISGTKRQIQSLASFLRDAVTNCEFEEGGYPDASIVFIEELVDRIEETAKASRKEVA